MLSKLRSIFKTEPGELDWWTEEERQNSYPAKMRTWAEYPIENDLEVHGGHNRSRTMAPGVNYCYTCSRHYRWRVPDERVNMPSRHGNRIEP